MILATARFAVFNLRPSLFRPHEESARSAIQAFENPGPNDGPLERPGHRPFAGRVDVPIRLLVKVILTARCGTMEVKLHPAWPGPNLIPDSIVAH